MINQDIRRGKFGNYKRYTRNTSPSSAKPGLTAVLVRLADLAENKRSGTKLCSIYFGRSNNKGFRPQQF